MLKSKMFRLAAIAVLKDVTLSYEASLAIVELLLEKANLEAFCEEQAAKKALEDKEATV